jgi:hypothetical protein
VSEGNVLASESLYRAIVVKFNNFQDREQVRPNARKLKGSRIGIAEQLPEEIEKIRQNLYPEMKKAKAQGHAPSPVGSGHIIYKQC